MWPEERENGKEREMSLMELTGGGNGLCFSTCLLPQNHSNFNRSGELSRVMYYDGGSGIDFGSEVVSSFQTKFLEGKPVNEVSYLFDFLRVLQIDFGTGKQRSIAWIDVNSKCFFPKSFVGDDFENVSCCMGSEDLEIEIDVRVNENANS